MITSKDISAAITVSFLTIAAGAAFGIWTGVGATLGIFSMALASIVGVVFGGIDVKTSGPTGPTAGLMFATVLALSDAGVSTAYNSVVIALSAFMLFGLSFFRVSKLLNKVPYTSLAIFVNGIALFITYKQIVKIIGFSSLDLSPQLWETGIAVSVVGLLYLWPRISKFLKPIPGSQVFSGALFVMFVGSSVAWAFNADVSRMNIDEISLSTLLPDFSSLSSEAVPYAALIFLIVKMSFVLVLVTLVTAKALTKKDYYTNELRNQGIANLAVACIGGVPVTIGFIRTKLLQKVGGNTVWAGVVLGVMVTVMVLFCKPVLELIPTSIFVGILIKAGISSLDLQAWNDFRREPGHTITFFFVLIGSVAVIFLDIVTVFIGSLVIWWLIGKLPSLKGRCKDLKECPCVG